MLLGRPDLIRRLCADTVCYWFIKLRCVHDWNITWYIECGVNFSVYIYRGTLTYWHILTTNLHTGFIFEDKLAMWPFCSSVCLNVNIMVKRMHLLCLYKYLQRFYQHLITRLCIGIYNGTRPYSNYNHRECVEVFRIHLHYFRRIRLRFSDFVMPLVSRP